MLAVEGLVPYSVSQPAIFKTENLLPVKNLTLLTQDHPVRPLVVGCDELRLT